MNEKEGKDYQKIFVPYPVGHPVYNPENVN